MHDDTVFANRFHYQLAMFGFLVLIWLSRFFNAHIAYVIDTDKIIAAFFRISYCLLDTLEFNRLPCSNNKIYDDADFADRFRNQLAMFEIRVLIWLS